MKGSHCRLYDENLVRNIMITTGVSIMAFVKTNTAANSEDVCEFVEYNADDIIAETIRNINKEERNVASLSGSEDDILPKNDEEEEGSDEEEIY